MSEKEDKPKKQESEIDDDALEKLAIEELLREAAKGAARAEIVGPSGWIKPKTPKTNKKFLVNTIRNAVASNNYHSRRSNKSSSHSSQSKSEHSSDSKIKKAKQRH